tara:strand:+ start:385 stop:555 length:171 start_codon:yes stop_codon:yes gene_type:complete
MIAVPSILIVAPRGIENDAKDLFTPYLLTIVFRVNGMDALLLEVLNVNMIRALSLE